MIRLVWAWKESDEASHDCLYRTLEKGIAYKLPFSERKELERYI